MPLHFLNRDWYLLRCCLGKRLVPPTTKLCLNKNKLKNKVKEKKKWTLFGGRWYLCSKVPGEIELLNFIVDQMAEMSLKGSWCKVSKPWLKSMARLCCRSLYMLWFFHYIVPNNETMALHMPQGNVDIGGHAVYLIEKQGKWPCFLSRISGI